MSNRLVLVPRRSSGSRRQRALLGLVVCASLLVSLGWCPAPGTARDEVPTREQAQRLLSAGRFDQAIEAMQAITAARPEEGLGWFDLAQAHHLAGDYATAHEVGQHAASFPDHAPTCLYNLACASALLGHADRASDELERALAAGFLDFDLLALDPDLALLRDAGRLPMPPTHSYQTLKHGRVEIPYLVLLPEGYDPARTYPAAVAFAPGGMGVRATDWALTTVWAEAASRRNWIVVCAAQPSNGWINHPSHHALNALMKHVRREHRVEQDRFHLVGLGEGGRPAAIYAGMSRAYVASLALVGSVSLADWDDREVRELAEGEHLPVALVVGADDPRAVEHAERVAALLREAHGEVTLDVIEGGGRAFQGVRGEELLARLGGRPAPSRADG